MSRLGKTPIPLPKGVEVKEGKGSLSIKGPKGSLNQMLIPGIEVKVEGSLLLVTRDEKKVSSNALYGLYRSLIKNLVVGVSQGFEKRLTLIGVGFRALVKGSKLELQVGYSFPVELEIPKTLSIAVEKGTEIIISGQDKQLVGQFAANVRAIRPPEPYKGKGIRYKEEFVRKKAGKAAKVAAK